jgi:hypothetical protein
MPFHAGFPTRRYCLKIHAPMARKRRPPHRRSPADNFPLPAHNESNQKTALLPIFDNRHKNTLKRADMRIFSPPTLPQPTQKP